jgi:hypothetical protein
LHAQTAYVGNVQPGISEQDLRTFFDERVLRVPGRPPSEKMPVDLVAKLPLSIAVLTAHACR